MLIMTRFFVVIDVIFFIRKEAYEAVKMLTLLKIIKYILKFLASTSCNEKKCKFT